MNYAARRSVIPSTRGGMSVRRILFLVTYMFLGSMIALTGATSAWAASLDIDRAGYSVSRDRLTVEGKSEDDAEVRLFDADSGVLFATVRADSDGNWRHRDRNPEAIPCQVRAESQGQSDTRTISNANRFPGGCGIDGGGGNNPPVVTNPGTQTNNEGDTVSLQIDATDDPGDTLSYSATGLPANLNINANTGLISGDIATATAANSPYTVTVDVSDGTDTTPVTFQWNVNAVGGNNPPVVTNPGTQSTNEGDTVSLQIVATDDPNQTLTYVATGLPANLSINANTGLITGTVTTVGTYSVTVSVTDDGSPPATTPVTFQWAVNAVGGPNQPPTAVDQTFPIDTAVLDRAGEDGVPGNAEVTAPGVLLGATDSNGDTLTAELVIGPTGGALVLNPDGSFSYTPNAGTTADSFTYQANDGQALSGVQTVDLTIDTGLQVNTTTQNKFNIMMNYELGMHCTGFEFAYCCVLPPYNSIIAQVARSDKGSNDSDFPMLLEGDPKENLDALGRETVLREPQLTGGNFNKYVLRYWHEAQPRNDGRGKPQSSTLISAVEGNSLFMWNTLYDAADTDGGNNLITGDYEGSTGVVLGDGDYNDANDNYGSGWMNHFYIYADLEGSNPTPDVSAEKDKIRLGLENLNASTPLSLVVPDDCGPAFHPMGPDTQNGDPNNPVVDNTCGGYSKGNLLTFSADEGTVVYTQMKVLENLPVMLTSPRIWEGLGLPLTTFEDSIDFFSDPGLVDEDSVRPFVQMKAQLHNYNPGAPGGVGTAVLDGGNPVIGFGTAPIDIPNCERCHSELAATSVNSAQQITGRNSAVAADVADEMEYWMNLYGLSEAAGDSTWYPRLKGAAISILSIHDAQHGTSFTANWPATDTVPFPLEVSEDRLVFPQNTRLGKESVICQKCHADNVIAVVKSASCGLGNEGGVEPCLEGSLIPPITEAIHDNHRNVSDGGVITFADSQGRDGGCQGCHPAHRSDGEMAGYPITIEGDNFYRTADNRDANGGCFVGRDVHSNPGKDSDGAETPEHLNAVGQYLADNVFSDQHDGGGDKGIWCTNCHTQLGQEIWRSENMVDLIHGVPGKEADLTTDAVNIRALPTLTDVALAVGLDTNPLCGGADPTDCAIAMLDPTANNPIGDLTRAIWRPNVPDANVATIEANANPVCNTAPYTTPVFNADFGVYVCVALDVDGDPSVRILEGFCTTPDCVAVAQATLDGEGNGSIAAAVPFNAATDGRDHWLAPGEPHCADCHAAPYTEQSGNINPFPPFNYPRKASLMRYSRGHQDISCQGCHESIHGLYPVTPTIDTTSYAQAANLNADGSHGPVKCASCHASGNDDIPNWLRNSNRWAGGQIGSNFDAAVTWAHTYTEEQSVLTSTCLNCHGVQGNNWSDVDPLESDYTNHAMSGGSKDIPRSMMDKAETELYGAPFTSANGSTGVCLSCHGNEGSEVSCGDTEWKEHLTEGRVAQSTWERVSINRTGSTCGW